VILELKDFQAGYASFMTEKTDLLLESGQVICLVGENGSGKSTLMKGIMGLVKTKGGLYVDEEDYSRTSTRRRTSLMSYLPQTFEMTYSVTVMDLVLMGFNPDMDVLSGYTRQMKERVRERLASLGMEDLLDKDFLTLSEGQKQKVRLARSLVRDTRVLLLDEPESTLDFMVRHEMMDLVRRLTKEGNLMTLLVLHDPNLALRYGDQVILFKKGRVLDRISVQEDSDEAIGEKMRRLYEDTLLIRTDSGRLIIEYDRP
jgi:iron complex transport system ATP-binding protein